VRPGQFRTRHSNPASEKISRKDITIKAETIKAETIKAATRGIKTERAE